MSQDFIIFIGRFHPLIVHLPIGFIIAILALNVLIAFGQSGLRPALRPILWLSVVTCLASVGIGTLLAIPGGYSQDILDQHRWYGIATTLTCIWMLEAERSNHWKAQLSYAGLLIAGLICLSVTGHKGGSLTHGEGYLTAYLPESLGGAPEPAAIDPGNIDDATIFHAVVLPIFNDKCLSCHAEDKYKGELRMHDLASLFTGGKHGAAIEANNASESLVIRRSLLPLEQKEHMPPKGKPQLTDAEIDLLTWWINQGAKERMSLKGELPSDDVVSLIEKLLGFQITVPKSEMLSWEKTNELADQLPQDPSLRIRRVSLDSPALDVFVNANASNPDELIAKLEPVKANIELLDLGGTTITKAVFDSIATFENLRELRLNKTQTTDEDIQKLEGLRYLVKINLYGSKVTDAVFKTLNKMPKLRQVESFNTDITYDAASAFIEGMVNEQRKRKIENEIHSLKDKLKRMEVKVVGVNEPSLKDFMGNSTNLVVATFKSDTDKYGEIIKSERAKVSVSSTTVHSPKDGLNKFFGPTKDPLPFAFHTANEKNPWVQVNLKGTFTITGVQITNRTDGGAPIFKRAKGLELQSLNKNQTWETIWKVEKLIKHWTVDLTDVDVLKRKANSYRLILNSDINATLHLSSLSFWGIESTDQYGTLLNKDITVSAISDSQYSLGNGIQDFVSIKEPKTEYTFHTGEESEPWVRLDFKEKQRINYFHYKDRPVLFERSKGLEFERLKEDGKWESLWKADGIGTEWRASLIHLTAEKRGAKSYRFIIRPPTGKTYMHPAHVRIFGTKASEPDQTSSHTRPTLDITGDGDWEYVVENGWGKIPHNDHIGSTHGGVVVDKAGNVYVSTDGPNGMIVYDGSGKFLRTLAKNSSRYHGLCINQEDGKEYIYGAANGHISKFDLTGNIVLKIAGDKYPEHTWKKGTAVAVAPNGDIFIADGYGSNVIFKYNKNGDFIKKFGLRGSKDGEFITCHGLIVDKRNPTAPLLIVCDRENKRLQHFDLEGNFVKIPITGLRRPCAMAIWKDYMVIAELAGRAVLLDKDYKIISKLGDNPNVQQHAKFGINPKDWKAGVFTAPHGCSFDADGNIYIQDWNKWGRITKLLLKKNLSKEALDNLLKNKRELSEEDDHSEEDIAPIAKISASSEYNKAYGKGSVLVEGAEWASKQEQTPWIQFDWDKEQTINHLLISDRHDSHNHAQKIKISFSDNSHIEVNDLPNNGQMKEVEFPNKTVKWVRLDVIKGAGPDVGFKDIKIIQAVIIKTPPTNIAPLSKLTASSEFDKRYTKEKVLTREKDWASKHEQNPWIQLDWDKEHSINIISVSDRDIINEQATNLDISFSDGSKLRASNIPDNGSPKEIKFDKKTVKWIRFQVVNGRGPNVGLKEIKVFKTKN